MIKASDVIEAGVSFFEQLTPLALEAQGTIVTETHKVAGFISEIGKALADSSDEDEAQAIKLMLERLCQENDNLSRTCAEM